MNPGFRLARQNIWQKGFTLIEVLITVLVLSIGLLGMAGLQIASLKMNQAAMSRSIASEYAYAMLDKMRSNAQAARNGDYDRALSSVTPLPPIGSTTAQQDLYIWMSQLSVALPGSRVEICRRSNAAATTCSSSGDFFVVRVDWQQGSDTSLLMDDSTANAALATASQSVKAVALIPPV